MNKNIARVVATATALMIGAAACATEANTSTVQAGLAAFQDDNRTLEEKVDTDGDGTMSDDEIEVYARSAVLDFSNCMRDNGYPDFTDLVLEDLTEGDGAGQGRFLALMAERGVTISDPNAIPTLQLCGELLSDLQTFAPQPSDDELQEQEEAVLEFAQCMRDGGLTDWPDPDFANNGGNGYGPELLEQFDVSSSEIQDAIATCQAENSSVSIETDEAETDDEGDEEITDAEVDTEGSNEEPEEDIERSPISPVIEGDTSELNVAEVSRQDLVQTTTLAGTLGYGDLRPFPTNTTGIITSLPADGDVIEFGEALFFVDNQPVLLFEGDIPQYREFRTSMPDGPDVEQLERNLVDFGFADDLNLTVDDDFTAISRDAIEALQESFGVEDTGRLAVGRVVFSSTPVRVGSVNVELGQSVNPQINVISITESEQRITVDLDAEDRSLISAGDDVDIELPDGTVVAGSVTEVAAVATRTINPQTGAPNDATIAVTIGFVGSAPDIFDAAPVDIIVTESVNEGVLTVPVPALVALSGGGHAVELIVEGGTQLISVELGDFVDELVEVSGDVREGDRVVMAAAG